ncbi:MAG: hypothetical protein HC838_11165 [Spirulinaceae cyanobacterium RM2_2_10]|nr:hypothetical protein [Spirulinaceae cyanobacterium RM2_2_10]
MLNEEQCSLGYRICDRGRTVVYAAAIDCYPEQPHPNLLRLAENADLLILAITDTSAPLGTPELTVTTDDSPWRKQVELAKAVGAKQLILSLHNPDHSDDFLDRLESEVRLVFSQASLAREGMIIDIA